jgi:hypothetical protein
LQTDGTINAISCNDITIKLVMKAIMYTTKQIANVINIYGARSNVSTRAHSGGSHNLGWQVRSGDAGFKRCHTGHNETN